jgi:uncharacterized protein YjcR
MALTEKRVEAKNLYIHQAMTCPAIAQALAVDVGTVYRWKTEAAEKGEVFDWDYQRQIYAVSTDELAAKYRKALAILSVTVDNNPEILLDPKKPMPFPKPLRRSNK